jgi:enamine deaminase RidA (YjgF/YER057c/UK114 family)
MAQRFNPADVWQPFGTFAMGVVQGEGRIVHLKGQVALDREQRVVGRGDMKVQLRQVLDNVRRVLAAVGGEMSDIIALTQYTTDIDAFMQAGDVRREVFAPPYPVTTTVGVRRLYNPELMVEITAIAEIPESRFRDPAR